MRLRDLIARPELGLTLLTGEQALDREVGWVFTTDLLDPGRYLTGGELVLTGLMWRREPGDSQRFVASLAAAGVAALGAGDAALGGVPEDLVEACRRYGLPLFEVPVDVSFRAVTDAAIPSLWAQRAAGLAALLGRQRGLVTALAEGAGLAELLPAMAAEARISCWVLTPTGRLVAGTGPLPGALAADLAGRYLRADRLPAGVRSAGRDFTVLAVNPRSHRLASWLLAAEAGGEAGDGAGPYRAAEAAAELAALVALERARLEEGVRVERRLAAALLRLLAGPAPEPAEVAARLAATGLAGHERFLAVAVTLASPGGATHVDVAQAVTDELLELARPEPDPNGAAGRSPAPSGAVPGPDGELVGLVPLPPGGAAADGTAADAGGAAAALRAGAEAMAPGLGAARLSIGVAEPATGAGALHAAVAEARHAQRLARERPGPVSLVYAAELDSHLLLLAAVPDETRNALRTRLLGPLEEYDRRHGASLVPTLHTFLDSSGSWTRCAQRLHVHVNTLRYRVARIERLTGRDLNRLADRVDFFLALQVGLFAGPAVPPPAPRPPAR